jgi:hypothetical protein
MAKGLTDLRARRALFVIIMDSSSNPHCAESSIVGDKSDFQRKLGIAN